MLQEYTETFLFVEFMCWVLSLTMMRSVVCI